MAHVLQGAITCGFIVMHLTKKTSHTFLLESGRIISMTNFIDKNINLIHHRIYFHSVFNQYFGCLYFFSIKICQIYRTFDFKIQIYTH
jgi:hypothetical protein